MSIWSRFTGWLASSEIARRVNLAVAALDDFRDRQIGAGGRAIEGDRDRYDYDRVQVLRDALDAWRQNPLARRIVGLTTEYVVSGGLRIYSEHVGTHAFLQEWWTDDLNRMEIRVFEWCDELTRTGELFPLLSTDAGGMTYVRAVPAADIGDIVTAPNDLEQEELFLPVDALVADVLPWIGYDKRADAPDEDGSFPARMLHFALNRPVGALRGESDLAPILRWLRRHGAWLEDRARLNRFRQAFLYVVHKAFKSESERLARQAELNMNPPNPGTILVVDQSETWEIMHPKLDSFEASEDGLSLKKMIVAGVGLPLHFLAEPESATRTTAEAAGGPAFRHLERRQIFFFFWLRMVARVAVRRRAMVDATVDAGAHIHIQGGDIFQRDNVSLAQAAASVISSFLQLRREGLIDDAELLRLSYKFAGEVVDVEEILKAGKAAGPLASVAEAAMVAAATAAAKAAPVAVSTGQAKAVASGAVD